MDKRIQRGDSGLITVLACLALVLAWFVFSSANNDAVIAKLHNVLNTVKTESPAQALINDDAEKQDNITVYPGLWGARVVNGDKNMQFEFLLRDNNTFNYNVKVGLGDKTLLDESSIGTYTVQGHLLLIHVTQGLQGLNGRHAVASSTPSELVFNDAEDGRSIFKAIPLSSIGKIN